MHIEKFVSNIIDNEYQNLFFQLYGEKETDRQKARYLLSLDYGRRYFNLKDNEKISVYSAPGRTEIGGNHTDHQKGQVIAAAIGFDILAFVFPCKEKIIIKSRDYDEITVELNDFCKKNTEKSTSKAIIKGILRYFHDKNYKTGGFKAYIVSEIPIGSGLSSSAAFENLIGTILNYEYNCGNIPPEEIALCSQYAENTFFGKPCGLMDQMASAAGGLTYMDFSKKKPAIKKIKGDFNKFPYKLYIVDTGENHSDLTLDYACITKEMKDIADYFQKDTLSEVNESDFYNSVSKLKSIYSHRSILRTIHFFEECRRVEQQADALSKNDFEKFLSLVKSSGISSGLFLQNLYSPGNETTQNVVLALALCQKLIGAQGAFRVHGGGFAGSIQAYVPFHLCEEFEDTMENIFGSNSCKNIYLRSLGTIKFQ